jgi:transcriptional regulator with XRE-family HTH domain
MDCGKIHGMKEGVQAISLVEAKDVLTTLREWVKRERQRAHLTQSELADKSSVPATTISRLERTGLASTDAIMRILFALNRLNALQDFITERLRFASFPETLREISEASAVRPVLRVRHRKGERA